jgi:CubicO group peptidase (beta-lactamase class C family)
MAQSQAGEFPQETLRRIEEAFDEQLRQGLHPGAQLVIRQNGKVLLDLASGTASLRRGNPVTPSTPFLTFSVTKPFTGVCVHKLIEEGKIELDAPVAEYWPEFGCRGKETATIRHVFLHQAGVPVRGLYRQILRWPRWKAVTRFVAALPAEYPPGTKTAYHLVNYGFILGEVVRRVSGLPVHEYLHHHFLEPLGLDNTFLGLPKAEEKRAAGLYSGHRENRNAVLVFRYPRIRRAVIPAATLHSTARELTIFYQMLLNEGEYRGKRFLQPDTIRQATTLGWEGVDGTIGVSMRWAYGFHLGGMGADGRVEYSMGKGSSLETFGHFGMSTCMAWADRGYQIAAAFTCNRMLHRLDSRRRWLVFNDLIWEGLEGQAAGESEFLTPGTSSSPVA